MEDERSTNLDSLSGAYIRKYGKFKDCLFFSDFNTGARISHITISEQPEPGIFLFINGLLVSDRKNYYHRFIHVNIN